MFVKDPLDQGAREPLRTVADLFFFESDRETRRITGVEQSPLGNLVYQYS